MKRWLLRSGPAASLVLLGPVWMTSPAAAHVKWFCAYSVERQPDGLVGIVDHDFLKLNLLAIGALVYGVIIDQTFAGRGLSRSLHRLRALIPIEGELFVRASCAFFLICLWAYGGILLTPELKTQSTIIPWVQLAFAACLIHRRSAVVTAFGIVVLFALALRDYGIFHMADYPIFLGVAAYLAAVGLERTIFGARPIDVLRWATAITLMWASVEKWAYPEWAFPLFVNHGALGLGLPPLYYMRAAGVVEFALAFALIATPLVRFSGAIILSAVFIMAIATFGKIDAVGHAPIIGVLFAIILDDYSHEVGKLKPVLLVPVKYAGSVLVFVACYYGSHALLYGTSIL